MLIISIVWINEDNRMDGIDEKIYFPKTVYIEHILCVNV